MGDTSEADAISSLRRAFVEQRLTLFLGAGVSYANGLPMWEKLVLSLYFATISEQNMGGWRPYPNYLYAISEWYLRLKRSSEPLEITARKVKSFYENNDDGECAFLEAIRDAIYGVNTYLRPEDLLKANATLDAIVKLCVARRHGRYGVRSVISYNYDSLLEMTLARKRPAQAIYSKHGDFEDRLPIFHVHGYVPYDQDQMDRLSRAIIFTEEQYNVVASDPYSWSNIVQLREMSSNVGLMIGLSLSDRNIRRLLDALSQSPVRPKIFALLKVPDRTTVSDGHTDSIHQRAIEILDQFKQSGIKGPEPARDKVGYERSDTPSRGIKKSAVKGPTSTVTGGRPKTASGYRSEIRGIIEQVERLEREQYQNVLEQLGIVPIWYEDHSEIPKILSKVAK